MTPSQLSSAYNVIGKYLNEPINGDETFIDLDVDSLQRVELVMDLERYFDIRIEDEEIENINSVDELVELLNKKL